MKYRNFSMTVDKNIKITPKRR